MKRPYETVVIFDGSLADDAIKGEREKLEKLFRENVDLEKIDDWGKRQLTYEINKKKSGIYNLFVYQGEGSFQDKLERAIKLNPSVLRHLSVLREPTTRTFELVAQERAARARPEDDEMGDSDDRHGDGREGRGGRRRDRDYGRD